MSFSLRKVKKAETLKSFLYEGTRQTKKETKAQTLHSLHVTLHYVVGEMSYLVTLVQPSVLHLV